MRFVFIFISLISSNFYHVQASNSKLTIHHEQLSNLTGILNEVTQTGTIFNYNDNAALLFNGETGFQAYVDFDDETLTFLPNNLKNSDFSWPFSFQQYLRMLQPESLRYLANKPDSLKFNFGDKLTLDKFNETVEIIQDIMPEREKIEGLNEDNNVSFLVYANIVRNILEMGRGNLKGWVMRSLNLNDIPLTGGLSKVLSVFSGLNMLINTTGKENIENNLFTPNFRSGELFNIESGAQSMAVITNQINENTEGRAMSLLAPIFKFPMKLYEAVRAFACCNYKGIVGVEALIGNLCLFGKGLIKIDRLIDMLIQVTASIGYVAQAQVKRLCNFILKTCQVNKLIRKGEEKIWNIITSFVEKLKRGRLLIGKINIWSCLTPVLNKTKAITLNVLVKLFQKFKGIISLTKCVISLYIRMISFAMSGFGLKYIHKLIPTLNLKFDFSKGSILFQLIKKVHKLKVIKLIRSLDFKGLLYEIPLFGHLLKKVIECAKAIHVKKSEMFKQLFKHNFLKKICGWIKYVLGMSGGEKPKSIIIYGLGTIGKIISSIINSAKSCQLKQKCNNRNID